MVSMGWFCLSLFLDPEFRSLQDSKKKVNLTTSENNPNNIVIVIQYCEFRIKTPALKEAHLWAR